MKQTTFVARLPVLALALAILAGAAWAQSADLLRKQLLAQTRLNVYRRDTGLPQLPVNESLNKAAQGHADYLKQNGIVGHLQETDHKGFTGKDPGARATTAGYQWAMIMENISSATAPERAVDSLIASVYHRLPFINHEIQEIGLGFSEKATVILFGAATRTGAGASTTVIFPGAGMINVPPVWSAREHPNPLPDEVGLPVGCPVSISFPAAQKVDLQSAALETQDGRVVDSFTLTPFTDPHRLLKREIFLVPKKPLQERTGYRATFRVQVDGGTRVKTWSFVTGSL